MRNLWTRLGRGTYALAFIPLMMATDCGGGGTTSTIESVRAGATLAQPCYTYPSNIKISSITSTCGKAYFCLPSHGGNGGKVWVKVTGTSWSYSHDTC